MQLESLSVLETKAWLITFLLLVWRSLNVVTCPCKFTQGMQDLVNLLSSNDSKLWAFENVFCVITMLSSLYNESLLSFVISFGDKDLDLRLSNPLHLRTLLEDKRFEKCRIVLLHASYPFSKEASYLSSVYPQVLLHPHSIYLCNMLLILDLSFFCSLRYSLISVWLFQSLVSMVWYLLLRNFFT